MRLQRRKAVAIAIAAAGLGLAANANAILLLPGSGPVSPLVGNQAASTADRSVDGVVGFNFLPGLLGKITPGETSDILIVRTNATTFTAGTMGIIDGTAGFAAAFQPSGAPPLVGPIPEPGTFGLLASGLVALVGVARKRAH